MEPTVSLLQSHFHNLSVASNYESTIKETLASLLTQLVKNGKEYHIKFNATQTSEKTNNTSSLQRIFININIWPLNVRSILWYISAIEL